MGTQPMLHLQVVHIIPYAACVHDILLRGCAITTLFSQKWGSKVCYGWWASQQLLAAVGGPGSRGN